jgi:DNA-binding MarR family transcriptional regulator
MSANRATDNEADGPAGLYDPGSEPEDLWFLPTAAEEDDLGPVAGPARAATPALIDGPAWRAAEAGLAADLAELAFDFGRLAERVATAGQGAVQRLAHAEAASLSWWTGDRIGADRLALWMSYRIGAVEEDGGGLIRAAWASRRLAAQTRAIGPSANAETFLASCLSDEGRGDTGFLEDVAQALEAVIGLSSVVRGCVLFHLWRSLDERPDHLRSLEAAIIGARLGAWQGGRAKHGSLPFLPLSLTGFSALMATGSADSRLAGWISGAHRAVLSALLTQDRLQEWLRRAAAETGDLSGRTPARLIAALAAHPMLAARQVEGITGASRAAVQRNLDVLHARGLVREVTGQGRFRIWAASLS